MNCIFNNILVVCVGNICRSPMAKAILQKKLPQKNFSSAGIAVEKSHLSGNFADKMAISIAQEAGYILNEHKAKQLTSAMCQEANLILVMERKHIEYICNIAPEVQGKIMLLGHWEQRAEVPDPYKKSKEAFVHAFKLIEQFAELWCKKI